MLLGIVFALISLVGAIMLLIEAFKVSPAEGFLTLCVPCYAFYFAFAKLDSPNKNLILSLWLGGLAGNLLMELLQAVTMPQGQLGQF